MAISSQAAQQCAEGSETRLYGHENLRVELRDYESPRAPGNQVVRQMWYRQTCSGVLQKQQKHVQALLDTEMRGISQKQSDEDQAIFEAMVCEEQGSRVRALPPIQREAGDQTA